MAELLPWNHYARKNIGYLFALSHGAKIIYETDDDNEIMGELSPCPSKGLLPGIYTQNSCVNIYAYFGHPEIWPRGYPLEFICKASPFTLSTPQNCSVGIEQGVVNGSPDVDALFRLTQDKQVIFEHQPACFLPPKTFCPINSQNTFFHPAAFFTLYLPSFVSMRVSDIWRGYVAQKLIWSEGACLAFSGPSAFQRRNEHCLLHDFRLEQALYLQSGSLVEFLREWKDDGGISSHQRMTLLFQDLVRKDFLKQEEFPLLEAWIHDLEKIAVSCREQMS